MTARVSGQLGGNYVNGATTVNFTFTAPVTAGNCIMVAVGNYYAASTVTVTDSLGNTYNLLATGGSAQMVRIYAAYNVLGGACTVTVASSASEWMALGACEYSGVATASPLDGSSTGSGSAGSTITSGKFASSVSEAVIFGMVYDAVGGQTSITPSSPSSSVYNRAGTGTSVDVSDVVGAPFQTHEMLWTFGTSHGWVAAAVAIKSATASTPSRIQIASDNFNRADENPIGGNWVNDTGYNNVTISSNKAGAAGPGSCVARWTPNAPTTNQWCQIAIGAGASVAYQGPAVRMQGSGTKTGYFLFAVDSTTINLYRFVNGSGAVLFATTVAAMGPGTVIALEVFGTGLIVTLRAYLNGAKLGNDIYDTAAERIVSAGLLGVHTYANNTYTLDDFVGGNFGAIAGVSRSRLAHCGGIGSISRSGLINSGGV